MKTLSARYRQAHKEAKWAIGLAPSLFRLVVLLGVCIRTKQRP